MFSPLLHLSIERRTCIQRHDWSVQSSGQAKSASILLVMDLRNIEYPDASQRRRTGERCGLTAIQLTNPSCVRSVIAESPDRDTISILMMNASGLGMNTERSRDLLAPDTCSAEHALSPIPSSLASLSLTAQATCASSVAWD